MRVSPGAMSGVVVATLCAVLLAGCGGDDEAELNLGGTAARDSSGSSEGSKDGDWQEERPGGPVELAEELPTEADARAAVQAWVDFYTAYADAAALADPDLPALRERMTKSAYRELRPSIEGLADNDQTQKGKIILSPLVQESESGAVLGVTDCVDFSAVRTYDKSGSVAGRVEPAKVAFSARLTREGSQWLIAELGSAPKQVCNRGGS